MVFDRLRRKKKEKGPQIVRSEFLKIKPIRNPQLRWEKDEKGNISIFIPLEQPEPKKKKRRRKGIISKMTATPKERRIQLDTVGSIVWEQCDGEKTVKDIAEHLHETYKLLTTEAELSLNTYFNQLSKKGLVGFVVPEEMRARLEEEAKKEKEKK